MYRIIEIPGEEAALSKEPLGSKPSFWYEDNELGLCMFKECTPGTGEDWAEKIAEELCSMLRLPHARYELAASKGRRGVITLTFVPPDGRLVLGNEVLGKLMQGYPTTERWKAVEHTLRVVFRVISQSVVQLPFGWNALPSIESSLDVFVGYLMLDSLIANTDRHHENWGFISRPRRGAYLAPTFDHGSGFGRGETDSNRKDMLRTRDRNRSMERYVERARSAFYTSPSSPKTMSTFEAFKRARAARPVAAEVWLSRLSDISEQQIHQLVDNVPRSRISEIGIEFVERLLVLNRGRLLQLREEALT